MGIPVYFKTIVKEYENYILKKDKLNDCKSLFLDLNCAIHPCCSGETDESIMILKIIQKIEEIIQYTNVEDLLYIAIDGIPPKGKMKQQRMRRYKSVFENKQWNTNAISPGTYFMEKLNYTIREWIKDNNFDFKIIFSDSNERGEGEHKILQYIKNNNVDKSVIYGLDADLIMLSLVSKKENIYLLRERTEYNIENTENEYIYLIIDNLKKYIQKEINNIDDYIFLCFFLGNDFINHIDSLSLRYGGYDILIDTYKLLQERYGGYFKLIDTDLKHCIHLTFLKEFLNELSSREPYLIEKIHKIRQRQYKITYSKYSNYFIDFNKKKSLLVKDIYDYQTQNDTDESKEMINNLPILYHPQENNYIKNENDDMCQDYLDSLIWTSHYYFKECIHWKWATNYDETPSLNLFRNYIQNLNSLEFKQDLIEYSVKDLLRFIFPNSSHKLHKYKIQSKEYKMSIIPYHKRYLWECPIIFE